MTRFKDQLRVKSKFNPHAGYIEITDKTSRYLRHREKSADEHICRIFERKYSLENRRKDETIRRINLDTKTSKPTSVVGMLSHD